MYFAKVSVPRKARGFLLSKMGLGRTGDCEIVVNTISQYSCCCCCCLKRSCKGSEEVGRGSTGDQISGMIESAGPVEGRVSNSALQRLARVYKREEKETRVSPTLWFKWTAGQFCVHGLDGVYVCYCLCGTRSSSVFLAD